MEALGMHLVASEFLRMHSAKGADADVQRDKSVRNACEQPRSEMQTRSRCRNGSALAREDCLVALAVSGFDCAV